MEEVDTIIWDWNGTLLNDTDICIESINHLLHERELPLLNRERYLEVFGFPVIDYYRRIGFNFNIEPFEIPAKQYIELYSGKVGKCFLHEAAVPVLTFFKSRGFKQLILSASEIGMLEQAIRHFNISHFFDELSGLDNHYATSKTDIGTAMLKRRNIQPEKACLIGDTTHDYEVAQQMGCQCILVAAGHQPVSKLKACGTIVTENLEDVKKILAPLPLFDIPDK